MHTVRLRVTWGGGEEKTWRAVIQMDRGELLNATPLGLAFDTPGSVFIDRNQLHAISPSPNLYGGADFQVRGTLDSRLSIELYPEENREQRFLRTATLRTLLTEPIQVNLDQQQNQFQWSRAPGDALQVDFDRSHLVFAPGEEWPLQVTPNLTGHSGRSMRCQAKIVTARTQANVQPAQSWDVSLDSNGSAPAIAMNWQVPQEEGVYDLVIELEPKWFQTSFQTARVTRKVQFLVIDPDAPASPSKRDWKLAQQLDPADYPRPDRTSTRSLWSQPQWLDRQTPAFRTIEVDGQSMLQLEPGDWHAVPIPIKQIGQPHQIEIEFGAESSLALGISLLQPDATGNIPTFGVDSGVSVDGLSRLTRPTTVDTILKHRITVWPRHGQPYLLLANRHAQQTVQIGRINVYQVDPNRGDLAIESDRDLRQLRQRRLLAFYELPLFADHFGAEKMLDGELQQPLDDWLTFYQGAQRLIDYLQANHYDGLVLSVTSDGSALYPSQRLQPTPRWDNGVFFSTGQDPIRKDVLEMMLRLFDRAGLELIPALTFSGPLPELEAAAHRQQRMPPYLRDYHQKVAPRTAELPWYDPLSTETQAEMRAVIDELTSRYRQHPSFRGVGLIARGDTSTVLSGRRFGFDPQVIRRFLEDHQLPLPQPDESGQIDWQPTIQQVLLDSHRQEWTIWRGQQLTGFLKGLADNLAGQNVGLPLVIASVDLLRTAELDTLLAPSLHWNANPLIKWNEIGWTNDLWRHPNLVMVNGQRIAPTESIAQRRTELSWTQSTEIKDYGDWNSKSELFVHRPEWAHFQALETANLFGGQSMPLWRLQPMAPLGQLNRQRFAQALWQRDTNTFIDGGWLLPTGQEDALAGFWSVFKQLPAGDYQTVAHPLGNKSPLAVRQIQIGGDQWGYVVNRSPWPTRVVLNLSSNEAWRWQPLLKNEPGRPGAKATQVEIVIEPFGLWGWHTSADGPRVVDWVFDIGNEAVESTRKTLLRLQTKLFQFNRPEPLPGVIDAEFQETTPLEHNWNFDPTQAAHIFRTNPPTSVSGSSDVQASQSNSPTAIEQSLRMTSDGQVLWVRSQPLTVPETGRLSISVWLRTDRPEQPPPLRIAVESDNTPVRHYYRYGTVGGLAPDDAASQINTQWKQFVVHFDDIPLHGVERLRIGFDLMGAGQVDLDRVQIFDRWLDSNDTKTLAQLLATSAAGLESSQSFDQSRRILESYWPQFVDRWVTSSGKSGVTPTASVSPENSTDRDVLAAETPQEKNNLFRRLRRATQPKLFPYR